MPNEAMNHHASSLSWPVGDITTKEMFLGPALSPQSGINQPAKLRRIQVAFIGASLTEVSVKVRPANYTNTPLGSFTVPFAINVEVPCTLTCTPVLIRGGNPNAFTVSACVCDLPDPGQIITGSLGAPLATVGASYPLPFGAKLVTAATVGGTLSLFDSVGTLLVTLANGDTLPIPPNAKTYTTTVTGYALFT